MLEHEIHRVTTFDRVAPFTLRVRFNDGTEQLIDFAPVLAGELFEPLRNAGYFDQVVLDEEIGTLSWPNGADFDPAMLYHWPIFGPELVRAPLSGQRLPTADGTGDCPSLHSER